MRFALRWDGSRAEHGDYRSRALAAGIAAQGGFRSKLVDQVVDYQVKNLGRSAFRTKAGVKIGKGCYALKNARPNARKNARDVVFSLVYEVYNRDLHAGLPTPSVPAIVSEVSQEWPVAATTVRTALRSIPGYEPPRISKARAGLSTTARDLLKFLEKDVPKSSVVVVEWSECLRKMYVPSSNASTKRSQKRRLDAAIRELQTTKELGLSIRAIEDAIIVGRGRAIPNLYKMARDGETLRTIKLSPGIGFGRAGLWSTEEGLMAQSLVEAVLETDEPTVDDNLGHLIDLPSERILQKRESRAENARYIALHRFSTVDKGMLAEAEKELAEVAKAREQNETSLAAIASTAFREGFVALWDRARTWSGLKSLTSTVSKRRINALGRRFAEIQAAPDARHAFETIVWRDTPKALRSPEPPKPPKPVVVDAAPVVIPERTPEEIERKREALARFEAYKARCAAEQAAERERVAASRRRYEAAGVRMDAKASAFETTLLPGMPGW